MPSASSLAEDLKAALDLLRSSSRLCESRRSHPPPRLLDIRYLPLAVTRPSFPRRNHKPSIPSIMPRFFCEYCDVYLTHDSMSVRKAHNSGRNHIRNVVDYYQQIGHEKTQSVIDSIASSYSAEGLQQPNMMQQPGGGFPPPPPGFPGMLCEAAVLTKVRLVCSDAISRSSRNATPTIRHEPRSRPRAATTRWPRHTISSVPS